MNNSKELYNLACRIEGTCSWSAIRYGLEANRGLDKLRFLKSRADEVWRWLGEKARAGLREHRERKSIKEFAATNPRAKFGDVVKPIAFYLPQFHTFPENDAWWGKGFTEWTNVKKAKPLFDGHYQPHVPHPDVGYYDLSDVEVMRRQAAMAKQYGIHGFCFYYYHFENGKRLLETPVNNWLAAKDIDFPFCFCWANENWTRAWDGGEKEIIMPQKYSRENMVSMMKDMLAAFHDRRYIKTGDNGNTPVLLVYRAEIIPSILEIVEEWRRLAKADGFDNLHLVSVQNFSVRDPGSMGMDAACAFCSATRQVEPLVSFGAHAMFQAGDDFTPNTYDNMIRWSKQRNMTSYARYKCVAPSWDNTPRRKHGAYLAVGSSPAKFKTMLRDAAIQTMADERIRRQGFLFINAWNEWGEGAHLEPDVKWGYGYLDACRQIMESSVNGV